MKKRNYFKIIALMCGFVCMCTMSSCCSVMDALYGPPHHHHHHCPPPPRHHHHYWSSVDENSNYDMAMTETPTEFSAL